jgi:hypothetical protein
MTGAVPLWHNISDAELAVAAAGGDRQAFAGIYDRYADRLYDFCMSMVADRDTAADCVQDAFWAAATNLTGLREPRQTPALAVLDRPPPRHAPTPRPLPRTSFR